jgi:hypothetical protein
MMMILVLFNLLYYWVIDAQLYPFQHLILKISLNMEININPIEIKLNTY